MDEQGSDKEPDSESAAHEEPRPKPEEVDAGIDLFESAIDEVLPKVAAEQAKLPSETLAERVKKGKLDLRLYHYTDAAGLQGIVESGSLFATSAFYLNDSSEIEYGCKLFASVLDEWCKQHKDDESLGAWLLNHLRDLFTDLNDMRDALARVYVTCFCEKPNLLSQWRAYGQSGGYSIGFRHLELEDYSAGEKIGVTLEQVIYKEDQQRAILASLLANGLPELRVPGFVKKYDELTPRGKAAFILSMTRTWQKLALREIVRFKHPAFDVEQEWRLVAQPPLVFGKTDYSTEAVSFRAVGGIPTPYIALKPPGSFHPIYSIQWGPTLERKRVEHSLSLLLKKNNYDGVTVFGSDIPVRL